MKFTESDFMRTINKVESFHKKQNADKCLSGRIVYYIEDFINKQIAEFEFVNRTKIEDIEEIQHSDICRTFVWDGDGSGDLQINTIRRPRKNEFRGIYKYVPNNAIVYEYCGTDDKDRAYTYKVAAIQQDDLTFKLLDRNKALLSARKKMPEAGIEMNEAQLKLIVWNYFDITESYGIAYDINETTYVFPMELEDIKEVFKNRGKDGDRKSVLPTVVNRNGKQFIRMGNNGFDLQGRHFYFVSGLEGTAMLSLSNKSNLVGDGVTYRNNDELVMSKKKERAIITSKLYEGSTI